MNDLLEEIIADVGDISCGADDLRSHLECAESCDCMEDLVANLRNAESELRCMLNEVCQLIKRAE